MLSNYTLLPLLAAGLSGLDSFYSGAIQKPAEYFNMSQINKARRLNQRAKAQKRGVPTAGSECLRFRQFYSGSKPYINPANDIKRNCNWKAKRKQLKRERITNRKHHL